MRLQEFNAETFQQLDEFRLSYYVAIKLVADKLQAIENLSFSQRPSKSTPSIVAKLIRQPTLKLSQIQDIAGLRVIAKDVLEQELFLNQVKARFVNHKLYDRRLKPSHGYRAVHLVVVESGKSVEIQIRTVLQHGWAQLSESIADVVGHDFKHGGGVAEFRDYLNHLSLTIEKHEERVKHIHANKPQTNEVFTLLILEYSGLIAQLSSNFNTMSNIRNYIGGTQ